MSDQRENKDEESYPKRRDFGSIDMAMDNLTISIAMGLGFELIKQITVQTVNATLLVN